MIFKICATLPVLLVLIVAGVCMAETFGTDLPVWWAFFFIFNTISILGLVGIWGV